MRDLDVIDLHVNRQVAMGAGVLDGDLRVVVVVAVDQQQEVDRSPDVEGPFPFDSPFRRYSGSSDIGAPHRQPRRTLGAAEQHLSLQRNEYLRGQSVGAW